METSQPQEDHNWINEFRNGSEAALSYYFGLYNRSLCYFAGRLLQNQQDAEDVVSDCFLKLWQRRESFQNDQSVKSFLYVSCRNGCMDFLKHLKIKSSAQQDYFKQLEEGEETILYQIMEAEFLEILSKEIDQLPEKCAEIFKLLYFEGKKTDEIAEQLDISAQTVRNQKMKAIELLKTAFLKKGVSQALMLALMLFIEEM